MDTTDRGEAVATGHPPPTTHHLPDRPRLMFQAKVGEYDTTAPERSWDISADDQRFLLLKAVGSSDKQIASMNVVLNWAEELKRLVK